jgi:uncharacterized caspase-like protein
MRKIVPIVSCLLLAGSHLLSAQFVPCSGQSAGQLRYYARRALNQRDPRMQESEERRRQASEAHRQFVEEQMRRREAEMSVRSARTPYYSTAHTLPGLEQVSGVWSAGMPGQPGAEFFVIIDPSGAYATHHGSVGGPIVESGRLQVSRGAYTLNVESGANAGRRVSGSFRLVGENQMSMTGRQGPVTWTRVGPQTAPPINTPQVSNQIATATGTRSTSYVSAAAPRPAGSIFDAVTGGTAPSTPQPQSSSSLPMSSQPPISPSTSNSATVSSPGGSYPIASLPPGSAPALKSAPSSGMPTTSVSVPSSAVPSFAIQSTPLPPAAVATSFGKQPSKDRPVKDKWALVVGISKFQKPELNLKCAATDARDFGDFLVKKCNFAADHVHVVTDEEATRARILNELGDKWLPRVVRPDDLVVVYVSTHGSPSDVDLGGVNYLVTWDTDPESLYASGLPMQDLMRLIKGRIRSDRVMIVLDACYSGNVNPQGKGIHRGGNLNVDEIVQGTGQLVISSSEASQMSWESKSGGNSVFTKHLMEALRTNGDKTKLGEAFRALKERVEDEVQRDRGKVQVPVLKSQWEGTDLMLSVPPTDPRPGLEAK